MERQLIYFMIDDLFFEVDKPEISIKQIRTTQIKAENEGIIKIKKTKKDKPL